MTMSLWRSVVSHGKWPMRTSCSSLMVINLSPTLSRLKEVMMTGSPDGVPHSSRQKRRLSEPWTRGRKNASELGGFNCTQCPMGDTKHLVCHSKSNTPLFLIAVLTSLWFFRPKFEDCELRDKLNDGNRARAVKMRGLPWKVTPDEIVEFFKNGDFEITTNEVVIERQDGKTTGYGLAFLPNADDAENAIDSLNREHIGTRFILLSSPWNSPSFLCHRGNFILTDQTGLN